MIDLLDVNVWIAMSTPRHAFRPEAEGYWRDNARETIAFCTVSMLGFVRVCSTAPVFDGRAVEPARAWEICREWMAMDHVVYHEEPESCLDVVGDFVRAGAVRGRTWTDAYLAAFAIAGGMRLVSLDRGFTQYPGLDLLLLNPTP